MKSKNKIALTFNYYLIDNNKTIAVNGIYDGSLIYVAHNILSIEFNYENGATKVICLSENSLISIA